MLRLSVFAAVVVAATALLPSLPAFAAGMGVTRSTIQSFDRSMLDQLNGIRVRRGLVPLRLRRDLVRAASVHDREMLAGGYFGHASADGQPFWQRIELFYPVIANRKWSVGENLYYLPGAVDSSQVISIWMQSAPHRANILDPAWRDVGVAALYDSDPPGVFGDTPTTVVTTDFGARG